MSTLEDFKANWENQFQPANNINIAALDKLVKSRVKKQTNIAVNYFWASLALQILVYALLSHVIVKYWFDAKVVVPALLGILIYVPFSVLLMKKFKQFAFSPLDTSSITSIQEHTQLKYRLLENILSFKRKYELFLVPVSTAIGVFVTFQLYVPGGVTSHWSGAMITFAISLLSCAYAIYLENKRNFRQPLGELKQIMDEFK